MPHRLFRQSSASVRWWLLVGLVLACNLPAQPAHGQFPFDDAPILYNRTAASDRVAQLSQKLVAGELRWDADEHADYLPQLLRALEISQSSQVLVFSKTSLQIHRISPETPRAIYFNDDTYVAWVQGGYMVEIGSVDDRLGGVFYSLRLDGRDPRLQRDRGGCNACHASQRTQRVPGFFIRSVAPRFDGRPIETGTVTDHRSPFDGRWGGWYVTGTHGTMRHLGNEVAPDPKDAATLDIEHGANVTTLDDRLDARPYLTPHSDLVALLVLEHQMQMHNLIALAQYETRKAIDAQSPGESADEFDFADCDAATQTRIATAGEKLVEYLLFCDEAPLDSPVAGTSGYADEFAQRGPRDKQGRSLRQLDLQTRLFRYPCSYLIYSSAFDALPQPIKQWVQTQYCSAQGLLRKKSKMTNGITLALARQLRM